MIKALSLSFPTGWRDRGLKQAGNTSICFMHKTIRLPQVELNLENATVVEILENVGAHLRDDDILMTIETQKAIEEVPCGASGYLRALLVTEGDQVDLHDPLAVLTDLPDGEFDLPATETPDTPQRSRPRPVADTGQYRAG